MKKKSTSNSDIKLSYHEKICAERMKTLFKAIDEMRKDIKELRADMNRGKGAGTLLLILGGLVGSLFYFIK
tara:strand:+ start:416 stop:628 length:213 start_codon:yes stop_codon:yes gene_type:complete